MARDTSDDTLIETRDQLVGELEAGCKPQSAWRIGTEHEKFGFYEDGHSPVPYQGPNGVRALLEGMESLLGWEPIMDSGNIIGLVEPTGGGAISLEPGGQFELSGAPVETIHQTCREANAHLAQVRQVADPLGIGFLGLGMSPKWPRSATPVMPKQRYEIMTNYMPKVGSRGLDMMYRTATIQVNLDFASEEDMVKKMRVGLALQPIATALFANSPFADGKPTGFLSTRAEIWRDTDNNRAGGLDLAFDEGFGFERYTDYALQIPMYFIIRDGSYIDMTHMTFADYLAGGKATNGASHIPSMGDWKNHLSTIFPDVRLKQFLEMRGADAGPWRRICALPAFWVGLLYDQESLDTAYETISDWTQDDRRKLRDEVPQKGFETPLRNRTVYDFALEFVDLARDGLRRRGRISAGGYDETEYLSALEETLALKRTQAEELLQNFRTRWDCSVEPIFKEYSF